jgi:hypothetical protein
MDDKELDEYLREIVAQYFINNPEKADQLPPGFQDINNVPAPIPNDQGNYLSPTFDGGRPGVAGQYGPVTGSASLGMNGLTPQDVGVSGRFGETAVDFNIPLGDPTQTSFNAQTPIGPGVGKFSGNIDPTDPNTRFMLEYILSLP